MKKEITTEELLARYVSPHKKVSREVTEKDIDRVVSESQIIVKLCHTPVGMYKSGFAIAHPQVDDKDPLRFFVDYNGEIYINPVIQNHTKVPIRNWSEGCLSYPDKKMIEVSRYNKIDVEYSVINVKNEKMSLEKCSVKSLGGKMSKVFQHEIDHLDGKYIYNEEQKR